MLLEQPCHAYSRFHIMMLYIPEHQLPVLKAKERVQILSALDSVDHVVVFSTGELESVIETLKPAVLTKGSNYTSDRVYGHDLVERLGGRVVLVPVTDDMSSSRIIDTIKTNRNQ